MLRTHRWVWHKLREFRQGHLAYHRQCRGFSGFLSLADLKTLIGILVALIKDVGPFSSELEELYPLGQDWPLQAYADKVQVHCRYTRDNCIPSFWGVDLSTCSYLLIYSNFISIAPDEQSSVLLVLSPLTSSTIVYKILFLSLLKHIYILPHYPR